MICLLRCNSDIPSLDLGARAGSSYSASPTEGKFSSRGTTPDPSEHGSRRTSFSSTGRPSISNRSGSGASSRSTSFSLPPETIGKELRGVPGERGEIEEEEMDEEGSFIPISLLIGLSDDNARCCSTGKASRVLGSTR